MLMKNAIKKIIKMSGITVSSMAAAAFTAYVTTKYLVRIALDREEPKAMQKAENLISGSQSSNEFLKELKEVAKKLEEKGNETVKIVSHDGTSLAGHWIPCKNPKRVIIAMHGWRSSWSRDFGMIADFWKKMIAACCMRSSGGKVAAAVIILGLAQSNAMIVLIGSIG